MSELNIQLGTLRVDLSCQDTAWLQHAEARLGQFVTGSSDGSSSDGSSLDGSSAAVRITYRVAGDVIQSPEDLCQARLAGLQGSTQGQTMKLWGDSFEANWQLDQRTMQAVGPAATYPLDLLLQAIWYGLQDHALIVHAAAFADDDLSWLCAGPSGSGKSTLAALFPQHSLGEELVGVLVQDDAVELVALPFWDGRPGRFPLCAVHLIRHREDAMDSSDAAHLRRRLRVPEALAGLRGQVSWPTWDTAAMGRCLDSFGRLLERVPTFDLAFRPQADVWPHLAVEVS